MSMTAKGPWKHNMRQMMSCGGSTPRGFEKPTDRGKHPHPPPPQIRTETAFKMTKREKERESLVANEKRNRDRQ